MNYYLNKIKKILNFILVLLFYIDPINYNMRGGAKGPPKGDAKGPPKGDAKGAPKGDSKGASKGDAKGDKQSKNDKGGASARNNGEGDNENGGNNNNNNNDDDDENEEIEKSGSNFIEELIGALSDATKEAFEKISLFISFIMSHILIGSVFPAAPFILAMAAMASLFKFIINKIKN